MRKSVLDSTFTSQDHKGSPQKGSNTSSPDIKEKLKIKKMNKEMSSHEKLALVEIKPIEKTALDKVFQRLCKATPKNLEGEKDYFVADDIAKVLTDLNFKMTRHEIDLMIWDVDENLDKRVDREEFDAMFRRCITSENEVNHKPLFNLVRFLMYAKGDNAVISEEDALELTYVRNNSIEELEKALKIIFWEEDGKVDGIEKKINFAQFLDRRNKKALDVRRKEKLDAKNARNTLIKKEGY